MPSDYNRDAHALPQEPGAHADAGTTKVVKQDRSTFRASVGHGTGFSGKKGQLEGTGGTGDPTIRYVNALTWARKLPRTGKFSTADQTGKMPINYTYDLSAFYLEY